MFINRKITRRTIQLALGSLWLLDGLLQLQPKMFTSDFANNVIYPVASGQPIFIAGPMHFFIHVFLLHPAIFNSFTIITQIFIGVLILYKKTTKIGLLASIMWGLFVWYIGEGLGGIASGHTLILMGAPGAALLYVILSIAILPKNKKQKLNETDTPAKWLPIVWSMLWIGGAIYQLLPGQNSVSDISTMIVSNRINQPGWLASIDNHVGNYINNFGTPVLHQANMQMSAHQMALMQTQSYSGFWFVILLFLIQIYIGIGIFLPKYFRYTALVMGIFISLIFWIIGQSFGGLFTGLATDPNSAILFILFAISIIGVGNINNELSIYLKKVEEILT